MLDHFHPLDSLEGLHEGYCRCFQVAGRNLLLIHSGGESFIIENRCPHMDWLLESGEIKDRHIICPKHRIQFDLASGQALAPGRIDPLARYDVVVQDGRVGLDLRQLSQHT